MAATAYASGDYYKTLSVDRSVDDAGIKRAYRKLALKYHPEKNVSPEALHQFSLIGEAYDVLTQRRAIYDQYGPKGLKNGVPAREGFEGFPGGYQYHGQPEETFSQFFGGKNPFADFFAVHTGTPAAPTTTTAAAAPTFGTKFGGLYGMNRPSDQPNPLNGPTQDAPLERDLELTLEELYLGTVKKLKVTRKTLNDDNTTTSPAEKLLTIDVRKGWRAGTLISFPREGDQGPNKIPSDIVFKVVEAPHRHFVREGNDLCFKAKMTLVQALTGSIVEIKTLDGRILKIPVNEVVHPEYEKIILNEGMPLSKTPEKRGNLRLRFEISFPTYLKDTQKRLIREALPA
ncbi:DnaJ domain-containing protein [Phlyctochytrium arcticum]|nr:DnaJ domain-containing protein [Phlyctochytrium arcticum]